MSSLTNRPVLVTGADGFIGKNVVVRLKEQKGRSVSTFSRGDELPSLKVKIQNAEAIIHLAGANRPPDVSGFRDDNERLTESLCQAVREVGRPIPILFSSSIHAELDSPYAKSKRAAERYLEEVARQTGSPVGVYRLPNVFGKWARPDYNSVVNTFCYNVARDIPIKIHDSQTLLRLAYIDDVVDEVVNFIGEPGAGYRFRYVKPEYRATVGDIAAQIAHFRQSRLSLVSERVGSGLVRALYATFVSYLPPSSFAYDVPIYADARGMFVEMIKTKDSGQISFFTARPGVTRGGHYHHTKTEKFLVVKGVACFKFRDLLTSARHELRITGDDPRIVESIPGWSHEVTNVGHEDLVVMLWANELFDRQRPDTIASHV